MRAQRREAKPRAGQHMITLLKLIRGLWPCRVAVRPLWPALPSLGPLPVLGERSSAISAIDAMLSMSGAAAATLPIRKSSRRKAARHQDTPARNESKKVVDSLDGISFVELPPPPPAAMPVCWTKGWRAYLNSRCPLRALRCGRACFRGSWKGLWVKSRANR